MVSIRDYILERIITTTKENGDIVHKSTSKRKLVIKDPETGKPVEVWKKRKAVHTSTTWDPQTGEKKITIKQTVYKSPGVRKGAGFRQRTTKRERRAMGRYVTSGRSKEKGVASQNWASEGGEEKKTFRVGAPEKNYPSSSPYELGTYNQYKKELEKRMQKARERVRNKIKEREEGLH